jgi:UDP-N-acetyl-D-glucosamine dehydrogenase
MTERASTPPEVAALEARLVAKDATVGVLGLGYVGLPLVREFLDSGFRVIGFDTDADKVRLLQAGSSYIQAVPAAALQPHLEAGRFQATDDFGRLDEPDALIICVPTPLTDHKEPDTSYIEATARAIAPQLRPLQLVVLESTTYPGTTDELLRPMLEQSGLEAGVELFVAYSPERENPGDPKWRTRDIPKVVGADDEASKRLARALYAGVVTRVVEVSSSRAAEASKLLENIYRCVNIALVNELKVLFERMDIDVFEVIEASKTKPFGFKAFYPGPGLGGHCIPIDPFYLSWKAREHETPTRFIELAGEINGAMPSYAIERCVGALNDDAKAVKGARVLVLGVAYKEDVDDLRESPALPIMAELRARGAELSYHDPHFPRLPSTRRHDQSDLTSVPLEAATLAAQDLVLIVTAHSQVDYALVARESRLIVDTRNALARVPDGELRARVVRA